MEHIGIDLGSHDSQVCIRNGAGEIVEETRCRTEHLERLLAKRPPRAGRAREHPRDAPLSGRNHLGRVRDAAVDPRAPISRRCGLQGCRSPISRTTLLATHNTRCCGRDSRPTCERERGRDADRSAATATWKSALDAMGTGTGRPTLAGVRHARHVLPPSRSLIGRISARRLRSRKRASDRSTFAA